MKKWLTSLNGAIVFSVITLLSEVWRGFLDAMFVLPVDYADESILNLAAVIFTLLFATWVWLLVLTSRGSRGALIATFLLNILILLAIPVSWLLFYCPTTCRVEAGIFNLANTLNLVFGFLAAIALGMQIIRGVPEKQADLSQAGA